MRKGPKIKIEIRPVTDNVFQFYDALIGAAETLKELAEESIRSGDHEQFKGTYRIVHAANDDGEDIGGVFVHKA